jgi:3D (Asp-Asp-Asp) domain-containing protein
VAVPRNIPLGSAITINSHVYIAEDRTAKRYDGFDIFMSNHADAKRFGKRRATVIVKLPPAKNTKKAMK